MPVGNSKLHHRSKSRHESPLIILEVAALSVLTLVRPRNKEFSYLKPTIAKVKLTSNSFCSTIAAMQMKKEIFTRGVVVRWVNLATVAQSSRRCQRTETDIHSR